MWWWCWRELTRQEQGPWPGKGRGGEARTPTALDGKEPPRGLVHQVDAQAPPQGLGSCGGCWVPDTRRKLPPGGTPVGGPRHSTEMCPLLEKDVAGEKVLASGLFLGDLGRSFPSLSLSFLICEMGVTFLPSRGSWI